MKGKIIGILFFVMLISAAVLPMTGYSIKTTTTIEDHRVTPPLPGDMSSENLELIGEYEFDRDSTISDVDIVLYNENIASLIQQVDEELYLDYLEGLVAFGPRVTTEPACYDAGEYILNEFEKLDLEARSHHWEHNSLHGDNIEATIPGKDETSDKIYVICAHYDSVPGSPGADDDGSGTTAVLAAANVMSNYEFNHTIRFVAFSGEEQGLYGSYYYVEEAVNNQDNIDAALNLDMVGYTETEEDKTYVRLFHEDHPMEWITDFTVNVAEEYYDFIQLDAVPSGYSWGSDHYRFWEAGYSAIFYFESRFNLYYHSPQDTIEHMDIDYAVRNTKLAIATLAELAELTVRYSPFQPEKPSGPTQGTPGTTLTYNTSATDPQNDQIYYIWDWGDGTTDEFGPFNSGETCSASHEWSSRGDYEIKVKAKDIGDFESQWSDPLSITMPRKGIQIGSLFLRFLEKHPIISRLIKIL